MALRMASTAASFEGRLAAKPAFIPDGGVQTSSTQDLLQGMEYLGPVADGSRKLGAPTGRIMNSWKVHVVVWHARRR